MFLGREEASADVGIEPTRRQSVRFGGAWRAHCGAVRLICVTPLTGELAAGPWSARSREQWFIRTEDFNFDPTPSFRRSSETDSLAP